MFTKTAFQRLPTFTRRFSTRRTGSSGSGIRGASEESVGSTNQTSNAPNYGTSNKGGGNHNSGASNDVTPVSASKTSSTSGSSQIPSTGASAMNNNKGGPRPASEDNAGGFSSFFKNTFGANSNQPVSSGTATESNNPNRPSIPPFEVDAPRYTNSDVYEDHSQERLRGTTSSGSSASVPRKVTKSADLTDYDRARRDLPFHDVPIRYAFLLWSIYKEEGALDSLDTDVENFVKSVATSRPLQRIFEDDGRITETNRQDQFLSYMESNVLANEKIKAFLYTLAENRRLSDLLSILQAMPMVRDKLEHEQRVAVVSSARELTDAERESIKNTIKRTFNAKDVLIQEEIKPEIGGGYEIYYDGQYHLDNTQKSMVAALDSEVTSAINSFGTK